MQIRPSRRERKARIIVRMITTEEIARLLAASAITA